MRKTVGVLGLGKIGLPLAVNLLEDRYTVLGYSRRRVNEFVTFGGVPATSSSDLARRCDVVVTSLPHDQALLDAVAGPEGVVAGAHPGLTVVDTGMHSLEVKESVRDVLAEAGVRMLDCPISGLPPQVVARSAVVFASGDRTTFTEHLPILESLTRNISYVGKFGAGSAIKSVANLLVAVHVLATAEAMALAAHAGLDAETVVRVVSPSMASSAQFAARAPMMADERYEPPLSTIAQLRESVEMIESMARRVGSPTPLLDVARAYYDAAAATGYPDKDVAAVFAVVNGASSTRPR